MKFALSSSTRWWYVYFGVHLLIALLHLVHEAHEAGGKRSREAKNNCAKRNCDVASHVLARTILHQIAIVFLRTAMLTRSPFLLCKLTFGSSNHTPKQERPLGRRNSSNVPFHGCLAFLLGFSHSSDFRTRFKLKSYVFKVYILTTLNTLYWTTTAVILLKRAF